MTIKKLPANTLGRDFVVGDLHGSLDKFLKALSDVSFDPKVDRVFSVGDLVDRGPKSFQTLELLNEPWFHAVLGNHESMMLSWAGKYSSDYHRPYDFIANGGDWAMDLGANKLSVLKESLIPKVLELPYLIVVDHPVLPFTLVHAQRIAGNKVLTDETIKSLYDKSEPIPKAWHTPVTWGRNLWAGAAKGIKSPLEELEGFFVSKEPVLPGVGLTYCGHSILTEAVLHKSHLHMDLGAYRNADMPLNIAEHSVWAEKLKSYF